MTRESNLSARFAGATLEELWVDGRLLERRLSHGEAVHTVDGINAADTRDETLVRQCEQAMERMHKCVERDLRIRLLADASLDGVTLAITASLAGHSIVTTPDRAASAFALLRGAVSSSASTIPDRALPMVWRNGSAAVLLHEVVGHPLEHGQAPIPLPQWLSVDVQMKMRRASFRDLPLMRMQAVIATAVDPPFTLPDPRIEVLLVDGGTYDPLVELVTLRIGAADLVNGGSVTRLAPFEMAGTRSSIVRSLAGAQGPVLQYPGVVCSREGQELVVESHAPVIVTVPR